MPYAWTFRSVGTDSELQRKCRPMNPSYAPKPQNQHSHSNRFSTRPYLWTSLWLSHRRLGHVRIVVPMVATFMDTAPPLKSDTCTIHLISDLASLDSFAAQLSGLSNGENSTAQFSAE
jgi:hypothetical protein